MRTRGYVEERGKYRIREIQKEILERAEYPTFYEDVYERKYDVLDNTFSVILDTSKVVYINEIDFLVNNKELMQVDIRELLSRSANLTDAVRSLMDNKYFTVLYNEAEDIVRWCIYQELVNKGHEYIDELSKDILDEIAANVNEREDSIMELYNAFDREVGMELEIDRVTDDVLYWEPKEEDEVPIITDNNYEPFQIEEYNVEQLRFDLDTKLHEIEQGIDIGGFRHEFVEKREGSVGEVFKKILEESENGYIAMPENLYANRHLLDIEVEDCSKVSTKTIGKLLEDGRKEEVLEVLNDNLEEYLLFYLYTQISKGNVRHLSKEVVFEIEYLVKTATDIDRLEDLVRLVKNHIDFDLKDQPVKREFSSWGL